MTDEEKTMKDYNRYLKIKDKIKDREERAFLIDFLLNEGYKKGLAEGRKEKWHDLRKNPDDLPKHSGLYCVQCGEVREYVKEEKSWFTVHFEPCMNCTEETYLWCELPKFEE